MSNEDGDFSRRSESEKKFEENLYARREIDPLGEYLASNDPRMITFASRTTGAILEFTVVREVQNPHSYPALNRIQYLNERIPLVAVGNVLFAPPGREATPPPPELVNSIKSSSREIDARKNLAEKLAEQEAFSGDYAAYLEQAFTRPGKGSIAAEDYKVILNLGPSYWQEAGENREKSQFVPYGEKVEIVFNTLRNIGEGKETIKMEDGRELKVPNFHAMPANRGIEEWSYENVIKPKLELARQNYNHNWDGITDENKRNAISLYENMDDLDAWITAVALFRHWDYDVKYSIGQEGSGAVLNLGSLSDEEWRNLTLETGRHSKDSAKARWNEVRRATEHGWGKNGTERGRREHPRPAGNPMSIGCYPTLITDFLDVMVTEMPVTEEIRQQVEGQIGAGNKLKNKLRISVEQLVYDGYSEYEIEDARGIKRKVRVDFPKKKLGDAGWDEVKAVNLETAKDGEYVEFAMGLPTEAFEVPYKLTGFYGSRFFSQIDRIDAVPQYLEALSSGGASNLLYKLNKPIDTNLGLVASSKGVNGETLSKLNNLVRANFLGTLAASVVLDNQHMPFEAETLVTLNLEGHMERTHEAIIPLVEAARKASFLPRDEKGEIDEKWKDLVTRIANNKQGFWPGDCTLKDGSPLFTDKELESLKPLFPLGVKRSEKNARYNASKV